MSKLILTADVHGSFGSWLTLKSLLNKEDSLVVAGDLFDTRYGNYGHADYQPESIKKELKHFGHPFYYVYGNCDIPSFYPGAEFSLTFSGFNKKIFLHHGHCAPDLDGSEDIIIQGHTHLCFLEKKGRQIFMNPGSIACPRNGIFTYGIIDQKGICLKELKNSKTLIKIDF